MMQTRVALGDVSNRNAIPSSNTKAPIPVKKTPAPQQQQQYQQYNTSSATIQSEPFVVTPSTCVPSLLHAMGLSQYAVTFMEHGVYTCGQMYNMSGESLRPFFASEEHYCSMVSVLHSVKPLATSTMSRGSESPVPVAPMEPLSTS
eukprot:PhF_6_TR33673/c1_g1_i2/m.49303